MEYIGVGLLGILFACFVNIYTEFDKKAQPLFGWCLTICFTRLKHIVVIFVMVGTFLLLYKEYGFTLEFIKYTLLSALLIEVSIVDIVSKTISNRLIVIGMFMGFIIAAVNGPKEALIQAILGLSAAVVLLLISWLTKGGVGMGDVKLIACIGIYLGINKALSSLVVSVVLSGIAAVVLLLVKKADRKGTLPFAPFVFLGTLVNLILR